MNNLSIRILPATAACFLLLVLCGCPTSSDKVIYHESSVQPVDSTCDWLSHTSHFHDTNYYAIFREYYANKLRQKDYASAGAALAEVTRMELYFLNYKDETLQTVRDFQRHYGSRLSWDKMLFVPAYLGNYYLNEGALRKAISYFKQAARHKPFDYNTCIEVAHAYGDMAFCYSGLGEHERALQSNLQALKWFEKTDNLTGIGGIYDNIALVHLFTKNYAESETYFDKAMAAYQQEGDTNNMFITLHNKILLYAETNDPKKYQLIDSAYRFFQSSGIEDESTEISLASFYVDKLLHEDRAAEAGALLQELRPHVNELQSPSADADYYIALAHYEIKTSGGMLDTGVIEQALAAVEESDDFQNQIAFSRVLKENALANNDYRKALAYAAKEQQARNGLTNREMIVRTMELNKKHQTEKKEQQIALQQKTILNMNIAIALLLVVLVSFGLLAIILRSRRERKKILAEGQRAQLYTRRLLEKTEEERKRIAGDLHDSVSHELLNLKHSLTAEGSDPGPKIDAIINDIRVISRNLHPVMFEKVGLTASIEQLVERAQSIYDLMVTADISYDDSLSTPDELQVYRIVQEALSNTIKYAEAVAAKITLEARPDGLHIEIKDNGKGFSVAEKLSSSSAFGLHNILERSKAIGGTARIHSDRNGTIITIEIKKHV